jgi:hypothetical protein
VSFRFNMPQKLSNRIASIPFNHLTVTTTPSESIPVWTEILKPNFACSISRSSSSSSSSSSLFSSFLAFLLLITRAQHFSHANPTPAPTLLLNLQATSKASISLSTASITVSILRSRTVHTTSVAGGCWAFGRALQPRTASRLGLRSQKLHARPHRRVLVPWTNSVMARLVIPCWERSGRSACSVESLPIREVYHWTRVRRMRDWLSCKVMNSTSPPGVVISVGVPVQAYGGYYEKEA